MRETGVSAVGGRATGAAARHRGARGGARAGPPELVPGVLSSEIDFAVHKEGAATLEDLLYRRLRTSLYAGSAREAAVLPAAERMARAARLGRRCARRPRCGACARACRRISPSATRRPPAWRARRARNEQATRCLRRRAAGRRSFRLLLLAMSALILWQAGTGEAGLRMLDPRDRAHLARALRRGLRRVLAARALADAGDRLAAAQSPLPRALLRRLARAAPARDHQPLAWCWATPSRSTR